MTNITDLQRGVIPTFLWLVRKKKEATYVTNGFRVKFVERELPHISQQMCYMDETGRWGGGVF